MHTVKIRSSRAGMLTCTVLCGLSWAAPAIAQEQTSSAQASPVLEEIIVTARKREESMQSVPVSISVIGAQEALDRGARRVRDLELATPNVVFTGNENNSLTSISVRGLQSQARQNVGTESGLGVYVDGVVQGRLTSFNQELPDIERVEFLRGPQGTLYGRNSTMGAINLITRQPDLDSPQLAVNVRVAELNEKTGSVYGSLPLSDKVAASLTLFSIQRDGFIRNVATGRKIGDDDTQGGRVKLLFQTTDWMKITVAGDALEDNSVGANPRSLTGSAATTEPYTTNVDEEPKSSRRVGGVSTTIEADVAGEHQFTSITAYRWANNDRSSDTDGTPVRSQTTFQVSDQDQFSQEVRLNSPGAGRLDYVVGAYFYWQGIYGSTLGDLASLGKADIFGTIDTRSYAAFANVDYKIFEKLTLNAGIRYTHEKKNLDYQQTDTTGFFPQLAREQDTQSDDDVSPMASLRYQHNDDLMAYVTVAQGYRSGGWNVEPQTSFRISSFKQLRFRSEKLLNYEVGFKSSWFGSRLMLNAAAFYIDYKDMQVSTRTELPAPFAPGTFVTVVSNAAASRSKGAEVEFRAIPVNGLTVGGNFGYTDAKYTDYDLPGTTTTYNGKKLDRAPDYTVSGFGEYVLQLNADRGSLAARVDYHHVGAYYTERTNDPRNETPSSDLFNARLTYLTSNGRVRIAAFAENVFDKEVITGQTSNVSGTSRTVSYGRPRVAGVEVGFKY